MNLRMVPALALLVSSLVVGCGGSNYGRSAYGTKGGYSLDNVQAKPANLMVARKIERPLYIVLDPARVKDVWDLSTPACEVNGPGCKH